MRYYLNLIFQIDEARKYLISGRLEELRLSLLLLDNAIEVQLEQRVRDELWFERSRDQMREQILAMPGASEAPQFREIVDWTPLSATDRWRVERFFGEKLKYLSDRVGCLDARFIQPLDHLHKYRNEAYHRSRVRPGTIRTACILLLELNCQLLIDLRPGIVGFSSSVDHSWFEERFGIDVMSTMFGEADLLTVVGRLRNGLLPTKEEVMVTLRENLKGRLKGIQDDLDFIVQNTTIQDVEEALTRVMYHQAVERNELDPAAVKIGDYDPGFGLERLSELEARIDDIDQAEDRLDAFDRFATIESDVDPVEEAVGEGASEVDAMIQQEIDRRRGK